MAVCALFGLAAGGLAYYFVPEPATLIAKAGADDDGSRIVRVAFEDGAFEVPAGLLARVKRAAFGPVEQLDLIVPWPFDGERIPTVAESQSLKSWLLLQFEPNDGRLNSRERFEKIFVHYFTGPPVPADAGLIQYDFKPDSPYAGIQLFVDRQANPPVYLRCDIAPSSLGPRLCERRFRLTERLYLRYRFDRDLLSRWVEVDQQVKSIVERVLPARTGS